MATGERAKVVTWVAKRLKKNPDVSMGELKKAAPKGMNIYPLIIGLARKEAGLSKGTRKASKKKRSTKKKTSRGKTSRRKVARKKSTKRRGRKPGRPRGSKTRRKMGGRRRGPGRPRKAVGADGLQGIARHMKDLEREVEQMRAALGRIADLAGSA